MSNQIANLTVNGSGLSPDKFENKLNYQEFINRLEGSSLKAAIQEWLSNLSISTRRNYAYYMTDMIRRKIVHDSDLHGNVFTVGHFNQVPHELVIDHIKKVADWGEGTKQVRAACYISLTAYLSHISRGWFRRAHPSTLSANPTFYQIRDKCATQALNLGEWSLFINALQDINHRDSLIARCMLQGAKRISEALTLKIDQIDFGKNIIRFRQKKTGGMIKDIPITYPTYFMDEIRNYINSTDEQRKDSQYVFITRTGNPITRSRFNYSFAMASTNAKIKKVTPHMLRATWVTLVKGQGVQDTEIMKVTGHTSSKMIYAYDKTSSEENHTKKLILI